MARTEQVRKNIMTNNDGITKGDMGLSFPPIAQARENIAAVKEQESEILAAPITETEIRTRLRTHLQSLAASLNDDLPMSRLLSDRYGTMDDAIRILTRKQSPFEMLLFFLGPEAIEKRLMATVGSDKTTGALSEDDYRKSLAAISRTIEQVEVEEERVIREAEANGFDIARRPDANPSVVLGA
jgi:hypothetical protein